MGRALARLSLERIAAGLAAAVCALPVPLPRPLAVAALAITFGWLPGRLVTAALGPRCVRGERALGAVALSPALAGGLAALGLAAGLGAGATARILAAAAALAVVLVWSPALAPREPEDRGAPLPLAPALLWAAIVLGFLAANPFLPPRSDGWFHAAVTEQIAARGLPVEDPSFAGLRLLYFWGMHVWAALWLSRAPALPVWIPWIALNTAGALAAILALAALARRLGASTAVQRLAAAAAIFGAAPFAWGWVAARAATGEVRGLDEVRRLVLAGGDAALRALGVGMLHPSLVTFADKFLVLTPFGLGIALFAMFLTALHDAATAPGARRGAWLAIVTAAALFTHTVAGMSALAVAWAWWALRAGAALRGAASWRTIAVVAGAIGAGVVMTLPYLVAVTRGKHSGLGPGFTPAAGLSLALGGALLVPAGLLGLARGARAMARDLATALLVLAGLGLLLRLPENNQSKFLSLLFAVLAAPAAVGLAELWRGWRPPARSALAVILIAALAPTAALVAAGFWCERGQSEDSWHAPAPEVIAAWDWLRDHTAPRAIVADEGGVREAMVLSARTGLAPGASLERDWGHPAAALAERRLASRELCARGAVSASTDSLLRALGRPLVVVERTARAPGDSHEPRFGALEAALAEGPRREMRYRLLANVAPLRFWSAEPLP